MKDYVVPRPLVNTWPFRNPALPLVQPMQLLGLASAHPMTAKRLRTFGVKIAFSAAE